MKLEWKEIRSGFQYWEAGEFATSPGHLQPDMWALIFRKWFLGYYGSCPEAQRAAQHIADLLDAPKGVGLVWEKWPNDERSRAGMFEFRVGESALKIVFTLDDERYRRTIFCETNEVAKRRAQEIVNAFAAHAVTESGRVYELGKRNSYLWNQNKCMAEKTANAEKRVDELEKQLDYCQKMNNRLGAEKDAAETTLAVLQKLHVDCVDMRADNSRLKAKLADLQSALDHARELARLVLDGRE